MINHFMVVRYGKKFVDCRMSSSRCSRQCSRYYGYSTLVLQRDTLRQRTHREATGCGADSELLEKESPMNKDLGLRTFGKGIR